ncbi:MAG: glycoside hydrolase family 97 N-terminal domain-containing protein, partial [Bacteroidales bacterium]
MKVNLLLLSLALTPFAGQAQKKFVLESPDKQIKTEVQAGDELFITILSGKDTLLAPSRIGMQMQGQPALGKKTSVKDVKRNVLKENFQTPLYKKNQIVKTGNEMVIRFAGDYSLVVRNYNNGVAYRFVTQMNKPVIVESETADYRFPAQTIGFAGYANRSTNMPFENQYFNSFENTYDIKPLTELNSQRLIFLPFLAQTPSGKKVCVLETDLQDYPGMFLVSSSKDHTFSADYATVPKVTEQGGHNRLQ